jgi:hypothetical protein
VPVYRPTYCTRQDVKSALDVEQTADWNTQVDSALEAAADDVDELCKRRFFNVVTTQFWDWPNYQYAAPWRVWFDERELADTTVNVPVVTSGGVIIPAAEVFWEPRNYAPPYTYMELSRATNAAFGIGPTPQRDIAITGTFGYWIKTRAAGSLAAAVTTTTATTITVTDSSVAGVGDVLTADAESFLVQDQAGADTGLAQTGSGCTTASAGDTLLATTGTGAVHSGEIITLDAESMLITGITGAGATVIRAVDGSRLDTHSGAEVYAPRLLTVERGEGGTTPATHLTAAAVVAALVPGQVHELALAEALNYVLQKTTGYARTIGENTSVVPGGSLPDLRDRVFTRYGRKGRSRVI